METSETAGESWDWIVIGSGFGGSVCGLRLVEKGYRVLMIEKGRRWRPDDFPSSNWDLRRWLWLPQVTALSGVGVGGGSLTFANTLASPKEDFFRAQSWSHLSDDWQRELAPHYAEAKRMMGAASTPFRTLPDDVMERVSHDLGLDDGSFSSSCVSVYFGEPGVTVPDPYFDGAGPPRTGCNRCGGCMVGCKNGAKNSLDMNYLWLAEARGLRIISDAEVTAVRPLEGGGYEVVALEGNSVLTSRCTPRRFRAGRVVFAGGVMGTVPLLLRMRENRDCLPRLSSRLGHCVRTNSEALFAITSSRRDQDLSKGIAIGSIVHTDDHSHAEPVRYPSGSGFFRVLTLPHAPGGNLASRLLSAIWTVVRHPIATLRWLFVPDWARYTLILLYMRTQDGHLTGKVNIHRFQAEADHIFIRWATEVHHWLQGGCCMGRSPEEGVIDSRHRVFGYPGLFVTDGCAVSANPGVNPSLTILALAERAMAFIPPKEQ